MNDTRTRAARVLARYMHSSEQSLRVHGDVSDGDMHIQLQAAELIAAAIDEAVADRDALDGGSKR